MAAVSPLPGAPHAVLGVIRLQGKVVPVLDLRRRLGLPARDYGVDAHLLVLRTPRRTLALATDEVRGVENVASAEITETAAILPGLERVTGIAALPDGLLYIYDIEAFLSPEEERDLSLALGEEPS